MSDALAGFKQGARATWASGNWDAVSELITSAGTDLLDRVGVEPAMDVLDVGTGSGGSVSIPAAQRGARVVGSDLAPELFDDARRRASEAGVEVEWVEADAEDLPFEDASFDRVLSTFGHMFAPRHAVAAAELVRVLRPGGVIGHTAWTPEGSVGSFFKAAAKHAPGPPPDFAEPPILWGNEDHVRAMYDPHGLLLEFHRGAVVYEQESTQAFLEFFEANFPPMVMMKRALGDRWPAAWEDIKSTFEASNQRTDGSYYSLGDYLITIARKPGPDEHVG